MRSILLTGFYLFFLLSGFSAVFVFSLGYIWVDLFSPQQVSYTLISNLPISMIVGSAAVGAYILFDRRYPPKLVFALWLIVIWAVWMTLTTLWAEVPVAAWEKWNWAIKTAVFAAFLPFVIRSRNQIEAMVLTIVLSLAGTMIAGGISTILSGGGYHFTIGLTSGNSGLAEGSTLSTTSIAIIPLILYARKYTNILPRHRAVDFFCYALIGASVLTCFGTYERTGLVALAVLGCCLWVRSRHKLLYASLALCAALIGLALLSNDWYERMSTITSYQSEDSALGRIAVWLWTLQYVADHPLGGGFGVYLIDHFRVPIQGTGDFLEINGKAFHSIYFEVLGEQGIVGFALFLTIIATLFLYLRKVCRAAAGTEEALWLSELAKALAISTLVYLAGGAFVGIAFQPLLYYFFACAISLHQYVARASATSVALSPATFGPQLRRPVTVGQG